MDLQGRCLRAIDPTTLSIKPTDTASYIDITFDTLGDPSLNALYAIDAATIDGDELTLGGAGGANLDLLDLTPTDMGDGTFRYYVSREFGLGTVTVSFNEGSWSDLQGNEGGASQQSFRVIDQMQEGSQPGGMPTRPPPASSSSASPARSR